ncbi:chaperone NapD [Microbulbifer elongatus]|uniref:chaperone NapD n=1 Tax=Microbulbifer elongatus TaxID=86173 RepID=UPI001CFD8CE0|nr:chaperone NapD [Microbulbifer elongatus]
MKDAKSGQCSSQGKPESLHIASLLVHVRPENLGVVSEWFNTQSELEIHLSDDAGKLVVIVETRDHHQINPLIESIKDQTGVLNVAMVYHEELALADLYDELAEEAGRRGSQNELDAAQPVKIPGEL